MSSSELPVGTVTFLFTDIEGSTKLLKRLGGERYGEALEDHRRLLRDAFAAYGGREIDTQGDSFFVAFVRAKDAVGAAIECQRRLAGHVWPDGTELRVRMGIHTGEPAATGERYVGLGVHRAARICAAGHGGQVLLSQTTRELLRDDPIADVSVRDLGEHSLKDMDEPERIYQLVAPGLREEFPALKTAAPAPFEGREAELAEAATEEMTRRWRRPDRRLVLGASFAAAIIGISVGALVVRGDGSTAGAAVSANSVGVVDPKSGDVVSEVPLASTPGDVAADSAAIWVTNPNSKTVTRIDPASSQVVQTIQVGTGANGVASGDRAVWVANGLDGTVSRVDPTVNREVQKIQVGNGPSGVAFGANAVWVTNSTDGTVSRIDPDSSRSPRTYRAAVGASAIAVGFGRVWIASPPTATLVVLDAATGRVLKEIGVGTEPSAVAAGTDAVWVANRADGTVSKIDPRTDAVVGLTTVPRHPEGVVAGPKGVWVSSGVTQTLTRLDAESGHVVETVQLGNPPGGLAYGARGVYVAVGSGGLEHRGGTLRVRNAFAPASLDPASGSFDLVPVLQLTNDGLVGFRRVAGVEGAQLVPDLALALPVPTEGGRTYTFQVRRGIRYSTGRLVQPEDFRRGIERVFEVGGGSESYYREIVGADRCRKSKPCDLKGGIETDRRARTVTFHLTAPDADFLAKLASPGPVAVPAGTPGRDMGARPVPATGPYRIASFDKRSRALRLVRNPRFREWSSDAQPAAFPDSIVFSTAHSVSGDALAHVRAVERGAADVAASLVPPLGEKDLEELAVRYPDRVHTSVALETSYFFLNTRVPPFTSVFARRAVNEAFDRSAYARELGPAFVSTCRVLPPNLPGFRPGCPFASGGVAGLDRARRLVRRSGTAGTEVTLYMPAPIADQGRYPLAVLRSLGYRARLEPVDVDKYFAKVSDSRARAQIGFWGWAAGFPSASDFLPPQFSCKAFVPASPELSTNVSQFCDTSIDALMTRAAAVQVLDPPSATKLWQTVDRELLAHAPVVPIYNRSNVDFVSKRVGNYQFNPMLGPLLGQMWVK